MLIVASGDEIGFICGVVIVDVINALVVGFESVVCSGRGEGPYLNRAVKTGGGEGVGVLGVDGEGHHVVTVAFEDPGAFPFLVPVPEFDCHIVGACQDERLSWMDGDTSNITGRH